MAEVGDEETYVSMVQLAEIADWATKNGAPPQRGEIVRMPLLDEERVMSAIKHSAEDQHAWLWFEDPALQALAARRGWVRP